MDNRSPGAADRRAIFVFAVIATPALVLDATPILAVEPVQGAPALAFAWFTLCTQVVLGVVALSVLLMLVARTRARILLPILLPLGFTALLVGIFIDRRVFQIFHEHSTPDMLEFLLQPDPWKYAVFEEDQLRRFFLGCGLLVILQGAAYGLFRWRAGRAARGQPWEKRLILLGCVLLALDGAAYSMAPAAWNLEGLTGKFPALSMLHTIRATIRLHTMRYQALARLESSTGSLTFAGTPLHTHEPEKKPNIVWIVLDSWRRDALDPAVMPELSGFAEQRATTFDLHFSTANSTECGMFGLLYGLPCTYFGLVEKSSFPPLLFTRLRELGYRVTLRGTVVSIAPPARWAKLPAEGIRLRTTYGEGIAANDRTMEEDFEASLDRGDPRPFFDLLFITSTHFDYYFQEPPRFPPVSAIELTTTDFQDPHNVEMIRNRYKSASAYADSLIGRAISALAARGLLSNTILMVTADHAESLGDGPGGYFGHIVKLCRIETAVPMVLYRPGEPPGHVGRLTSHTDIAATFLSILGVEDAPALYSFGQSLLDPHPRSSVLTCSGGACALMGTSEELVFPLDPSGAPEVHRRDTDFGDLPLEPDDERTADQALRMDLPRFLGP